MSANPKEQRVARFYFGGVAGEHLMQNLYLKKDLGALAACCTHPLDLLKVQLQTQQTKVALPQLVSKVYKSNGILGFYNGLSASVLRQMTYSLAR
jgi:dicarboxylate transporter 10